MDNLIQPRILKGFRDFLPSAEIRRSRLIEKITAVYRSFGFVPIDTPALEYSEILLRKSDGETEKQVFRFEDNGGRDVALRFDLTVPFARFTAEHKDEIYFPFKRYHVAKVWRGEKPQAGRYREFVQCDIDTVGSDSAASDFEILYAVKSALSAVGADDCTVRVNHRGVFNRFLAGIGVREKSAGILRCVDKLSKVGEEEVRRSLSEYTGSEEKTGKIVEYISLKGAFPEVLEKMESLAGGPAEDTERLRSIYGMIRASGTEGAFVLDPSITRGLDYYTGVVYETFLNALPSIGSVCSGGRYDNLAGLYMKERVSGVGGSIGLDRLIAALEQLGLLPECGSYLDAEIFCLDERDAVPYQRAAVRLRALGVAVEVFPDARKMARQYAVAEAKRVPWGITISGGEIEAGTMTLKDLRTRTLSEGLSAEAAAEMIRAARNV